jgi:hypothetical protein
MVMTSFRARPRRHLPGSPFNVPEPAEPPVETYAVNDRVTHDKYGLGTVTSVEDGIALIIDFGSHKQRIKLPSPKLTRL